MSQPPRVPARSLKEFNKKNNSRTLVHQQHNHTDTSKDLVTLYLPTQHRTLLPKKLPDSFGITLSTELSQEIIAHNYNPDELCLLATLFTSMNNTPDHIEETIHSWCHETTHSYNYAHIILGLKISSFVIERLLKNPELYPHDS